MPYMAPEQFSDFRKANFAADIYSLGKILYEAICGKLNSKMVPFKSVSLEDPETELLKAMDGIIRKATDEDHHKRYQTVSDQIFYLNSRFHLRNVEWASKPVVRVTWLGAQAFANHYDERLPTYDEWQLLSRKLPIIPEAPKPSDSVSNDGSHSNMMMDMEVMHSSTGSNSGSLNGVKQEVVKEWLAIKTGSSPTSHVVEWPAGSAQDSVTRRYPWEGFYDVSFRTVMDAYGGN